MRPDVEFFLYSKPECQLCDTFLIQLKKLLEVGSYTCHIINVDSDPELKQRYGARIPVLVAGNMELCEQVFNKETITNYINNI